MTGFWEGRKTEGRAYGWETHSTLWDIERVLLVRSLNLIVYESFWLQQAERRCCYEYTL